MTNAHVLTPTFVDRSTATQDKLRDEQQALFTILSDREREFSVHPDAVIEYPEPLNALLHDPVAYLEKRIYTAELIRGRPFNRAVVLTTYGDFLGDPLTSAGYHEEIIHMPAGPDNTRWYSRELKPHGVGVFYLEAVNEMDEKIQPTFVFKLDDDNKEILAGMSGSVWEQDGKRYAYISTVVARRDAPAGTGNRVAENVWRYLRDHGVSHAHLGTQTADGFYKRQGFSVIHTIVPQLRYRQGPDGHLIGHDLVIMEKNLEK